MTPVAVYVHVPFCLSRCGYCDFNTYALKGAIVQRTVEATLREIGESPWRGRPSKTVFFGGGTPSFLDASQIAALLGAVLAAHPPEADAEVSSEANPGTADAGKFAAMRRAGVNRLSIGAQSFRDGELAILGRTHRADDIGHAVALAREAGFANLNLDLMFGLPGQTLDGWIANLRKAVRLRPEHVSAYCLTIEPGTPIEVVLRQGKISLPDEDEQLAMLDGAAHDLASAGYELYEISNYAIEGRQCRHNLCYWRGEEYLGYGPGAVGTVDEHSGRRVRRTNLMHPTAYCEAIESGADHVVGREELGKATLRTEKIMLGLRLAEGVDLGELVGRESVQADLAERGLIEVSAGRLRLTQAGRHLANDVIAALV